MILSKRLNKHRDNTCAKDTEGSAQSGESKADYQNLDFNSVRTSPSRSIGDESVITELMSCYGFDDVLQRLNFSPKQIDYAKHLIIGRAVHPSSERVLARWINDDSTLKELIGSDERMYDNTLHRTALLLWERREQIEQSLRAKAAELFSPDETIILYDLTDT